MIRCPACGNHGDCSDDVHFEVRGKHNGMMVRKCLRCDQGLYVKAFGKPRVIQPAVWARMQEMWEEEFGEKPIDPNLDAAWDRLIDSTVAPFQEGAGVAVLFTTTVGAMARVTDQMTREYSDDWAALSSSAYEAALRISISFNLYFWLRDGENHAFMTKNLDCRPSETIGRVWDIYLQHYVPADQQVRMAELLTFFEGDDASRAFTNWVGHMREAAGLDRYGDLEQTLIWPAKARDVVQSVDETYWSVLRKLAEESA
jgi:hypothetical protein